MGKPENHGFRRKTVSCWDEQKKSSSRITKDIIKKYITPFCFLYLSIWTCRLSQISRGRIFGDEIPLSLPKSTALSPLILVSACRRTLVQPTAPRSSSDDKSALFDWLYYGKARKPRLSSRKAPLSCSRINATAKTCNACAPPPQKSTLPSAKGLQARPFNADSVATTFSRLLCR